MDFASVVVLLTMVFAFLKHGQGYNWSEWWTYDGFSGPKFWGRLNPEWTLCSKGKHQSPINIEPRTLLFDPNLKHIRIDKHRIHGVLVNTGHDLVFQINNPAQHNINITGGPFSYHYRIHEIHIHFGSIDEKGSEHAIDGYTYPAEIQIVGYNGDLYQNYSHALQSPHGLAIVAVMVKVDRTANPELEKILADVIKVKHKATKSEVQHVSIHGLLPPTTSFMTYEGSITWPGCYETVTWIIMNKPIYMTPSMMDDLRHTMQGYANQQSRTMENNVRPTMPVNHRVVRTNIDFPKKGIGCRMERDMMYKANMKNEVKR